MTKQNAELKWPQHLWHSGSDITNSFVRLPVAAVCQLTNHRSHSRFSESTITNETFRDSTKHKRSSWRCEQCQHPAATTNSLGVWQSKVREPAGCCKVRWSAKLCSRKRSNETSNSWNFSQPTTNFSILWKRNFTTIMKQQNRVNYSTYTTEIVNGQTRSLLEDRKLYWASHVYVRDKNNIS